MFGIGPSEMVVIAVLFLLVFGPSKLPEMARDIGSFVGKARGVIDEFKDELTLAGEPTDKSGEDQPNEAVGRQRHDRDRREKARQRHRGEGPREGIPEGESPADDESRDRDRARGGAEYDL